MNIEELFFISKIDNFSEIKHNVLNSIEQMGKFSYCNKFQHISNTDYHLNHNFKRPYTEFIVPCFMPHLIKLNNEFGYNEYQLKNIWFQQYEKNDFHNWHCHSDCTFTNIAYIELPNKKITTQVKLKGKDIKINVAEGEMLSMPGFLVHGSPINKGARKTVVVMNSLHFC
jgi:hypothetical protein